MEQTFRFNKYLVTENYVPEILEGAETGAYKKHAHKLPSNK